MKLYYVGRKLAVYTLMLFLAGCATRASHLRLGSSLNGEIVSFSGAQYIPLDRLCEVYGLDYKWDDITRKALIRKGPSAITLMSGSRTILADGAEDAIDRPVIFSGGVLFVPVSFARNNIAPLAGKAPVKAAPEPVSSGRFRISAIVLDAGHGGKDVGAVGRRLRIKEKVMALELVRKIKNILEESGIKVIMTRDRDVYISLAKRAETASRSSADLFISVHINASRSRSLRGFECYYLSPAINDNARALEALENAHFKPGDGAEMERSGRLEKTLWDMALTENRIESRQLAGSICDSVEDGLMIGNRGIRSARFYVLRYSYIPAVLVEAGYISNRYEEKKFREPDFLNKIARAVARGILNYKKEYERTEGFTRA